MASNHVEQVLKWTNKASPHATPIQNIGVFRICYRCPS